MAGYPAGRDGKDADLEDDDFDDEMTDQLHQPQQRNAANARERARMRVLSKAFCRLKTTLPWVPPDTKLSKLDTLRLATSYIAHLRAILKLSENDAPDPSVQPMNMSWPFNFQVNWDTQTARSSSGDPASTKQDWSTCTTYPDRKPFPEQDYRGYGFEDFQGEPRGRSAHQNYRNAKTRRKNNLHCYEIPRSVARGGDQLSDSSYYKSCTYYGQC